MEVEQEPLKNLLRILNGRLFDVDFDPDEFKLEVRLNAFRPSTDLDFSTKPPRLIPRYDRVRLVAILFAAQGASLASSQIQPRIEEFHYRSGKNLDLFAAGYDKFWDSRGEFRPMFDASGFDRLRRDLEEATTWRYSGDVDLILANAMLDRRTDQSTLDFASSVVCQLDQMLKDGAIQSVGSFLEKIFQYTDSQKNEDPTWGLSDHLGLGLGKSVLVNMVARLLPETIVKQLRAGRHFAVRSLAQ